MHLINSKNYTLLNTYYVLGILPTLLPILDQPYKAGVIWGLFTDEEAEGHSGQVIHLSLWVACGGIEIQPPV